MPEPVPYVTLHLRMIGGSTVHRGDLDTGEGIITVCGKYPLRGRYEETADEVTCRMCLRTLEQQAGRSD